MKFFKIITSINMIITVNFFKFNNSYYIIKKKLNSLFIKFIIYNKIILNILFIINIIKYYIY